MLLLILVITCVLGQSSTQDAHTHVVRTASGLLRGNIVKTWTNKQYYSFRGIPYAEPPLGDLRFLPPKVYLPWNGTRDALAYRVECPQIDPMYEVVIHGEEDCLYLNVFTPVTPQGTDFKSLPVMVYIHGGGFTSGAGDDILNGPDFIVDNDVILVTINYRLGALGFLSLEDTLVPGNNGMKDQLEGLRWVQRNIEYFGGDKTSITIFGHSAGSASVHHLMLCPQAAGLFHKVIAQSGSAINAWALVEEKSRRRAFELGENLGFKTTDPEALLAFLRNASAFDIVEAATRVLPDNALCRGFQLPFTPVVEPRGVNNPFLKETPEEIVLSGKYNEVPLMMGYTSRETIMFIRDILHHPEVLTPLLHDLQIALPLRGIKFHPQSSLYRSVIKRIAEFYFANSTLDDDFFHFADLQSEIMFTYGIYTAAKMNVQHSQQPTFLYQFSYEGGLNRFKLKTNTTMEGASHGDELCYIFKCECETVKDVYPSLDEESKDAKMIQKMTKLWTNFAKTGNPTPERDELFSNITWPAMTEDEPTFLDIDEDLELNRNSIADRIQFWSEMYDYLKNELSDDKKKKDEL